MRTIPVILCVFFLLPGLLVFGSFESILEEKLSKDSSYLLARMEFENSRLENNQKTNWFMPYVTVGGANTFGATITDDKTTYSVNLPVSVTFKNVYGFDFAIGNYWRYNSQDGTWKEDGWAFSVSRQLFADFDIEGLVALQKLENSAWSLLNARNNVFTSVVDEIFNDYYYGAKLEILNIQLQLLIEQVDVIQQKYHAGVATLDELLKTQKELQTLTQQLTDLQRSRITISRTYSKEVFDEMLEVLEKITSELPGEDEAMQIVGYRPDIKASEIGLEIAKRRCERSYQTFLPNPSITASVKIPQNSSPNIGFAVSFGLSLNYTILDRGERNNSYEKTIESYNIQQKVFEEKLATVERDVKRAVLTMRVSEYSKKTAELDFQLAKIDYERTMKAAQYLSEQDIQKAKIQLRNAEIELSRAYYNLLMARVNYLKILGMDLVDLVGRQVNR